MALLHYWYADGKWSSEIDDASFFLDVDGAHDPEREWDADRRTFLAPVDQEHSEQHAQCQFPARFALMKKALGWSDDDVPRVDCREFTASRRRMHAASLSVVFVSYNIESPTSAFGHTMLYLGNGHGSEHGAALADYSVSFEANMGGMSPMRYVPKGLLGGLSAGFRLAPLYERVHKYERQEERELWVLPLRVEQAEIDQLVRHLWELRDITFRYGFFGANCAQKILAVLHAVAPKYELLPYSSPAILPLEVGRRLVDRIGLAEDPIHRPSLLSLYSRELAKLSPEERKQLEEMITSRTIVEGASPATLSAALTWSEFETPNRTFRRDADTVDDRDQLWIRDLWAARVAGGTEDETRRSFQDSDPSPIQAHLPSRVTMGGGYRSGSGSVLNASVRWLLHEVVDPQAAYPPISSLEVARVDFGISTGGKLFVDEATALRAEKLAPASDLQSALAWKFDLGVRRLPQRGDMPLHLGAELGIGAGTALTRSNYSVAIYSLAGVRPGVALASRGRTFLPAAIWSGGFLLRLPANFRARVSEEYALSLRSLKRGGTAFKAITRKGLTRNLDLELRTTLGQDRPSAAVSLVSFR